MSKKPKKRREERGLFLRRRILGLMKKWKDLINALPDKGAKWPEAQEYVAEQRLRLVKLKATITRKGSDALADLVLDEEKDFANFVATVKTKREKLNV